MNVRKTLQSTYKVHRSLFGEFWSRKGGDVELFRNRSSNGEINQSSDPLTDDGSSFFELSWFDVGIWHVGKHGVVTTWEGGGGDFDFDIYNLSSLGIDRDKLGGGDPSGQRPAISSRLDYRNRSALGIIDDKVLDTNGVVLSLFGVVSDLQLSRDDFSWLT